MKYLKKYESFFKPKGMTDEEFEEFSKLMNKTNYAKNKKEIIGDKLKNIHIDDVTEQDLIRFHEEEGIEPEGSEMNRDEQLDFVIGNISEIQNSKEPITVYRILSAKNKESLNLNDVGIHFTMRKDNLKDFRFLQDIGIDDDLPLWELTCKIHKKDISVYDTVYTNFLYPFEHEVMLKQYSKVEVVDINPQD